MEIASQFCSENHSMVQNAQIIVKNVLFEKIHHMEE